jgi:hypothetical protein
MAMAVLAVISLNGRADEAKPGEKAAAFEQFKQLAGDWVGKETHDGKESSDDILVNYKVVSAGSAVVETLLCGSDHEMITVIHRDGKDLALTHYCALGNQPHMRAKLNGDSKSVAFKFAGVSNLKSDQEMHMHDATFTFVDKDTLKTEWTHFKDGKNAGTVVFLLKRKK